MSKIPKSKPQQSPADTAKLLAHYGVKDKVSLVAVRGYYRNTLSGGKNGRGDFDDALFLVAPECHVAFNGNTDPSSYRKGSGRGSAKGMASLKSGLWRAHKIGLHKGQYTALVQTAGPVTVIRDGSPNYEDTGHFGINIHRGGVNTTSSLGCQTIPPAQWEAFIALVKSKLKEHGQKVMPYLLIEEDERQAILDIKSDITPKPADNLGPALNLIREFEGLYLKAYLDPVNIPTIGWTTCAKLASETCIAPQ